MDIKADQFPSWHKNFVEKELGIGDSLKMISNLRRFETIQKWGRNLVQKHQPDDPLKLPDFMKPQNGAVGTRSGEPDPVGDQGKSHESRQSGADSAVGGPRKLICSHCGERISFAEGKYCWNNSKRFGGLQYCRDRQGLF